MSKKIVVLGAGLVGRAIATDLKNNLFDVTAVDVNHEALRTLHEEADIRVVEADISDSKILAKAIGDASLVVGAVPGHLGFAMMKTVINAGKDLVDISFCPEDYLELDDLAKKHNVTILPDIGVAPGLSHLICGYHSVRMQIESFKCMVGGLPVTREWPMEYKASWSPHDVIEEYTRPARLVENGKLLVKEALSDPEIVNFAGIGSLEAWNSDGLRSLIKTMPEIPDMVEKTLRYPGTTEYLRVLRELGFFSANRIDVEGMKVRPLDLTAKLLFPRWELKKGEKEFTVMRVIIHGKENGRSKTYSYDLYDASDERTGTSSMARTTGYTCAAAASLVLEGGFNRKGVIPPEIVGRDDNAFEFILDYLKIRNISLEKKSREIKP